MLLASSVALNLPRRRCLRTLFVAPQTLQGFGNMAGDMDFWDRNKQRRIGVTHVRRPFCLAAPWALRFVLVCRVIDGVCSDRVSCVTAVGLHGGVLVGPGQSSVCHVSDAPAASNCQRLPRVHVQRQWADPLQGHRSAVLDRVPAGAARRVPGSPAVARSCRARGYRGCCRRCWRCRRGCGSGTGACGTVGVCV
jgi:hypothetical protein